MADIKFKKYPKVATKKKKSTMNYFPSNDIDNR